MSKYTRGFTLVELLVVISIIAILSVIGITIFTSAQNSAKNAKVKADLDAIYKNIEQARILQQKTLQQITGSVCSDCEYGCRANASTATCIDFMKTQYAKITTAELPIDPWGNAYTFDENENDGQPGCRKDTVNSPGPDHTWGTADDTWLLLPTMFC